jgi:hypothetical protein
LKGGKKKDKKSLKSGPKPWILSMTENVKITPKMSKLNAQL